MIIACLIIFFYNFIIECFFVQHENEQFSLCIAVIQHFKSIALVADIWKFGNFIVKGGLVKPLCKNETQKLKSF